MAARILRAQILKITRETNGHPVKKTGRFADCTELLDKVTPAGEPLESDMDVAMYLIEEAGVAVVPGSGFLADGFIRISYAASEAELSAACSATHAAVNKLA